MTALRAPLRLLTIADWEALPADDRWRSWELQEGSFVMTPSPRFRHTHAAAVMVAALSSQLSNGGVLAVEADVNLELAPSEHAATVRKPALIVVTEAEAGRVSSADGVVRASGVVLAVEILSPGSERTDRIVKAREYADAGIPHYWIVDLDAGPSLTDHQLVAGAYRVAAPVTGRFAGPPYALDLGALLL